MKKILFIERDSYWMNTIGSQFMLKPEYQLDYAMTFAEGMSKLQQGFQYHAVVVSLNTIFQDNQESVLVSNLKAFNPMTQVIVVLENNDPHKYVSFVQSGAHAVLSKPFSIDAICAEFEKPSNNSGFSKPKEVTVGGLYDLGENTKPAHEFNPAAFDPFGNHTPPPNHGHPGQPNYAPSAPAGHPGNYQPSNPTYPPGYVPHTPSGHPGHYPPNKPAYEPGYGGPVNNPHPNPGYNPYGEQPTGGAVMGNYPPAPGYAPNGGYNPNAGNQMHGQNPSNTGIIRIRDKIIIAVHSPKGGVGKSTISKELASVLAMSSFNGNKLKVCLVDMDLENGDIATMLDIKAAKNITDWADNIRNRTSGNGERIQYSYEEIDKYFLLEHPTGLKVLAAPLAHKDVAKINEDIVETIYENLKKYFDIIVVDTGPNIRDYTLISLEKADNVVLVADTDVTTINEIYILRNTLEQMHYPMSKIGMVINNVPPKNQSALNDIVNFLRFPLIGSITRSAVIEDSNNKGSIMVAGKDTAFTIEIKKIANSIVPIIRREAPSKGGSNKSARPQKESKSILAKLFKK